MLSSQSLKEESRVNHIQTVYFGIKASVNTKKKLSMVNSKRIKIVKKCTNQQSLLKSTKVTIIKVEEKKMNI